MQIPYFKPFESFLKLEKGLSQASIDAYLQDLRKLHEFLEIKEYTQSVTQLELNDLQLFLAYLNELGLSVNSQARIISGLKAFFQYLLMEEVIADDPTVLLSAPKLARYLPSVLSHDEVEAIIAAIDHSKKEGLRNRAIIEILYAC